MGGQWEKIVMAESQKNIRCEKLKLGRDICWGCRCVTYVCYISETVMCRKVKYWSLV